MPQPSRSSRHLTSGSV
ncbi:hypothetical protein QR98_0094920 [Sarcoptes scabiei]|uniref:Uncharacterized protein n=1 Tax=Sarcoptes scabiei TaxID=52283 RepID=A0A132AJ35_SARSC|nr:hypothetical protein QR98_0094920 [Sarcoptes scabiei]